LVLHPTQVRTAACARCFCARKQRGRAVRRELAVQLAEQVAALGRASTASHAAIVGGLGQHEQAQALRGRPHVVVATPGRLADMLAHAADLRKVFARVAVFVLDEADRLLEPTFAAPLRTILEACRHLAADTLPTSSAGTACKSVSLRACQDERLGCPLKSVPTVQVIPRDRQTLLLSATFCAPLATLSRAVLCDPFVFRETAAAAAPALPAALTERYLLVPAKVKEVYLAHVLAQLGDAGAAAPELRAARSAIVFCATQRGADLVAALLAQLGIAAAALHSGKAQKARLAALHQVRHLCQRSQSRSSA
jgi:ATP-dependent RNA helicase DDX49/DBP8